MSQCIFRITVILFYIIKSIEVLLFLLADEQTEDRVSAEKLEELGIVL